MKNLEFDQGWELRYGTILSAMGGAREINGRIEVKGKPILFFLYDEARERLDFKPSKNGTPHIRVHNVNRESRNQALLASLCEQKTLIKEWAGDSETELTVDAANLEKMVKGEIKPPEPKVKEQSDPEPKTEAKPAPEKSAEETETAEGS